MEKLFQIQRNLIDVIEETPLYERTVFQNITLDNHATGILGARGIGKTTFLLKTVIEQGAKERKALYISADNIYLLNTKLIEVAEYLYQNTDVNFIAIDEIHKYKNWQQELKNIVDMFPNLKVLFTGSSMIDIIHGKYDLSRRVTLHYLNGFSFREYLELEYDLSIPSYSLDEIINNHVEIAYQLSIEKVLKKFKEYCKTGYYPFFKRFSYDSDKFQAVQNTFQKVIFEDVATLHSLKTPTLLTIEKLFKYIIQSPPGSISIHKIATALNKDHTNVAEYLWMLSEAGLISILSDCKTGKAQLKSPSKLYPENTNIIYSTFLPEIEATIIGKIRETFFFNQVKNADYTVYYSQAADFLVENITFEVGGKSKTSKQIKNIDHSYIVADEIQIGEKNKIPLYLFGFLY